MGDIGKNTPPHPPKVFFYCKAFLSSVPRNVTASSKELPNWQTGERERKHKILNTAEKKESC